jgi:pimeloyl-ACP methyl ester carboxylesterase
MSEKITIENVKTASFDMKYFRFGEGKKTFVIIPGVAVQSVMGLAFAVEDAYRIFEKDYTAYLFDRRKDMPEGYSIADMARDTAEAIKTLGLCDIYMFGASQGGMIAMTIAIQNPELVRKLVVGSSAARVDADRYKKAGEWVKLAKEGDAKALYLSFGKAVYPPETYAGYEEALIKISRTVKKEELESFITMTSALENFDITDKLDSIECPVLLLGSEDDDVLGAEATREVARHLRGRPGFDMHMYNGYGHAAYDTAPDYKERILKFFDA